jgi:hypothetical protein
LFDRLALAIQGSPSQSDHAPLSAAAASKADSGDAASATTLPPVVKVNAANGPGLMTTSALFILITAITGILLSV